MRMLYTFLIIILLNSLIYSQVSVRLQQPPPNQLTINDLWNATLTNTSDSLVNVYLKGTATESLQGKVMEATSTPINLEPGEKTITYEDVKSGNVIGYNDEWRNIILNTGSIPSGGYEIKLQVFSESGVVIDSDSIFQRVEIIAQLELVSPQDDEVISAEEPALFIWLPPVPVPPDATYKIKIVEIIGDQSPEQAITGNKPFFEKDSIAALYYHYSDSDSIFVSSSYYAWRIEVTGSENLLSETRGFYFGKRDACITWDLLSDESVTTAAGNILGVPESIGVGPAPTMSVFNYNSNGQRLWVGNTGWIAGSLDLTRYIEFNASPVSGNNLNVTNVSFNYGDNQIATDFLIINSQVFYSTDNWATSTALSQSALVYLNSSMSTFSASNLNIAVSSGQTFSLRIYPYAVKNGSAMTPTFVIHNDVKICGTVSSQKRTKIIVVPDVSGKWGKLVELTASIQTDSLANGIGQHNQVLRFIVSTGNKEVDTLDSRKVRYDTNNAGTVQWARVMYTIPSDSAYFAARMMGKPEVLDTLAEITVEIDADSIYSAQRASGILRIQKHETNLSLEVMSDSIGQTVMFKAVVMDSDSNSSIVSYGKVEFFVNNKFVDSDSTNSSGIASVSYYIPSLSDSVNLSIKASFTGDAAYEKSEATLVYNNKYDPDAGCSKVWESLGRGTDGQVSVILEMGGDVYAGGSFTNAGGTVVNHIAKWDGTVWSPLGSGINGDVNALAVLGTDLYAGGYFTTAGGVSASSIAKWDGSNWSALGSGINDTVKALVVINDELYAAGNFKDIGGITANNIAKWDGKSWSSLGNGLNIDIHSLAVIGSDLYAGGKKKDHDMDDAAVDLKNIVKWDGSSWSTLGNGLNIDINTLAVIGADLYAGGKKKDYDWDEAVGDLKNIVKWDGISWSTLGNGLNIDINTLAVFGSDLYAGGLKKKKDMDWDEAAGDLNNIAIWDGTNWSALGTGMNQNYVQTIAAVGGDLYAGGLFNTADGISALNIAKYSCNTVTSVEDSYENNLPGTFKLEQNYPNPFNPSSIIKYDIPKNSFVKIIVYDILGREVSVLLNEEKSPGSYEVNFDAKDLASGIYFYTINTGEFYQSKKMILLK